VPSRPDLLATPVGRRCLFALLYFAEGAPIGYIWWALPTRLRAAGVPIEDVTQLSALLTLPWAFKFLWAPLVDALRPRRGGLRVWITGTQIAMGATLLPIAGVDPVARYDFLLMMLLAHAFSAATQDVAIDALAVASTPAGERGSMTGWMQIGMLGGRATFGGLALQAEAWLGAAAVVYGLVGLVWTSSILVWLAKEEPSPAARNLALRLGRFVETLSDVLSRRTTWLGLGLAVVAGAAMEATGSVAGPMLIDRGLDKAAVGFFFALPAVVCMGAGALLGGFISDGARDRERTLAFAVVGLAGSVTLLATAASTEIGPPAWVVVSALAFAYVFFGIYTASAYALFMEITDPRLGGTQFSAYMGGINLCSVWSGWVVGRLAGQFDYSAALVAMAAFSLLALPLLTFVRRARIQLATADLR
jgi:MFS family permease